MHSQARRISCRNCDSLIPCPPCRLSAGNCGDQQIWIGWCSFEIEGAKEGRLKIVSKAIAITDNKLSVKMIDRCDANEEVFFIFPSYSFFHTTPEILHVLLDGNVNWHKRGP